MVSAITFAQSSQEVSDFSKVMLDVDAQVEIVYSTQSKVLMNLSDDETKDITVSSKNGSLVIKQNSYNSIDNLRIRIYTDRVEGLAVMGSTDVTLRDFITQENMTIQTKDNATVDTGSMEIKHLNLIRTSTSNVVAKNVKNLKETVDGVLVAVN